MKKNIIFIFISISFCKIFVSTSAFAEIDFGAFVAPEEVQSVTARTIQAQCPEMYKREHIPVTFVSFIDLSNGKYEYLVSFKGRGYIVQDPHWNMAVIMRYSMNDQQVLTTRFENWGDCR